VQILLLGNPNSGKSTLFNSLTGLRQKVGNFPGVTVDQKSGRMTFQGQQHEIVDFPGIYGIYPKSAEEQVVYNALNALNPQEEPCIGLVVVDASNLERGLFLFSQLADLQIPLVLAINMVDLAQRNGVEIKQDVLEMELANTPVVLMNARVGLGKDRLLKALQHQMEHGLKETYFSVSQGMIALEDISLQEQDAEKRFQKASELFHKSVITRTRSKEKSSLDGILTHPILGYFFFALILIGLFQAVFTLSSFPMDAIEQGFHWVSDYLSGLLPKGPFQELVCNGMIPGISGVLVFIPQIALLFFFIALLEDSGYMARAVFLMDRLVRPFGMNGRSVVPLLSSMACAIPGIMATRGIPNPKERLITLFVAPLMSCSARIPVYTLIISVVIPSKTVLGFVQLQGLVLFALYFLGIVAALTVAWVMQQVLRQDRRSLYLIEIPEFKPPHWRNILMTVFDKIRVFVLEAGGIILALSIVIWAVSNYGPTAERKAALRVLKQQEAYISAQNDERERLESSVLLEHSYLGKFGKGIEPIIAPLGYDWKIGIAIGSSFLAREVFVGTLSTIYAHAESSGSYRLKDKLLQEKKADGSKKFTLASGISLMVFYVFALQCLSTLAVARRETGSWRIPIIQLLLFGAMAYGGAFLCYQLF